MVKVGDVIESNFCGKYKVVNVESFKKVTVTFLDTGYTCSARCDSVMLGTIKDRILPSVHGVGFIGDGKHKASVNGKDNQAYLCWQRMLGRCYDPNNISKGNYIGCKVDPEWHNFQNFAEWYYKNLPDISEKICLDKDIKNPGNRIYSSDNCMLVSYVDNLVAAKAKRFKAKSPSGETVHIYNLAEFCRNNGLNKANMHKVLTGKHKSCKGWRACDE